MCVRKLSVPLLTACLAVAFASRAENDGLVLLGGTVYPSPQARPIVDAFVLVKGGKIASVGKRHAVVIPSSAEVIDCSGRVVTAGFWNSHVHFTEPIWNDSASAPADVLERHMQEMLTRWGVTAN